MTKLQDDQKKYQEPVNERLRLTQKLNEYSSPIIELENKLDKNNLSSTEQNKVKKELKRLYDLQDDVNHDIQQARVAEAAALEELNNTRALIQWNRQKLKQNILDKDGAFHEIERMRLEANRMLSVADAHEKSWFQAQKEIEDFLIELCGSSEVD